NNQPAMAYETRPIAAHQPIAHHAWSPIGVPIHSPRRVSITGVTGWCSANPRSAAGSVSVGTNALLTYGTNMITKVNALAPCAPRTSRPAAADSQEIARMNVATSDAAASHSSGVASGRQPTANAT